MANRPIRFGQAQGLEITADRYTQGHERLENVELDLDDVIRKRDGADSVPLTRDGGALLEQPVDLFFRDRELAVSDGERIYAQRTCALAPAASTGSFVERGAWSRGTLQESVGAQETVTVVLSAVRLEMPPDADGHTCALEAWTTSGAVGVRARNLGDGLEDVFTVDAAGSQVRGGITIAGTQGLLTWQTTAPADTIRYSAWNPGQVALGTAQTILSAVMAGDAMKRWDFAAFGEGSGGFGVWCAITGTQTLSVRGRKSSTGGLTPQLNIALPAVSTARRAAAIAISPTPIAPDVYRITVAAGYQTGGNERYAFAGVNYDVAANTLTLVAGPTQSTATILGTMTALAIAASPVNPTTEVHALVERDNAGTSLQLHVGTYGVGDTLLRVMHRCGLVSQFRSVPSSLRPHRNLVVICELSQALLANGYFLCEPFRPPGPFSGALPYEVYGRAWVGQARVARGNVVGAQSLVGVEDVLLWAAEGRTDPGETLTRQVAQARFELQRSPMPPAPCDRFVVQAMGGFARFYDGAVSAEHDWHTLPVITAVGNAGGGLTAGARYTVAVQFWWPDATGREHRSAFSAASVVLAAGQGTVTVTINTLQITERFGVRALTYISDANGAILYRRSSDPIGSDQTTSTVAVIPIIAVDTSAEQLDTESIGGDQASITGFCALAGGRLWGPSSRRANLAQFSAFPTEGFTPRWDIDSLVEFPEQPTVIRELEGRAIVLGRSRISALLGDGPDNNGGGDDYAVKDVPTPLGGRSQAGSAQTPLGLLYDSGRGPRLLDRGLSVQDVGAAVAREYEIEGETVRSAAYDSARGVAHLVGNDSGEVLIFSDSTLRWARDVREDDVLAVAVDERGNAAWLRSSDVLIHAERTTYSPLLASLHASSGLVPAHMFAGVRLADYVSGAGLVLEGGTPPTRPEVTGVPGIYGRQSFAFTAAADQAVRCVDTTACSVSSDLLLVAHVRLASAANGTVAGKQSGIGVGWNLLRSVGLQRVTCTNSAGAGVTASLTAASDTVGQWRTIVAAISPSAGSLRIASDLELGSTAVLPAGLPFEASAIPLRLGDSALAPLGFTSFDGELGALLAYRNQPGLSVATADLLALAQAHHAAWTLATGIPTTRDTCDGTEPARLLFSTGWLRAEDEAGTTHLPHRIFQALLAGEYEGDHPLTLRLYGDYDDSAPVATYRKSELDVAVNHYAGRQYLYRFPFGGEDRTYRAVRLEIDDGAVETASFRTSRLDLAFAAVGDGQAEADEELDVPEISGP
jgi:hypothetical protein